ncbi:YxeA family protein [Virgibacillus sp. NKC19-16]|uniref:YxeA family protein n=1 Tax=Virgibacillus salidurans TaxID=2831673 RepID=UPI001F472DEE|nr:YxeA family protein [Virgibacillus sp. NKC19-16]UJL47169.1 YxeA family protein [Virgibacillus sp. NKC19-16]
MRKVIIFILVTLFVVGIPMGIYFSLPEMTQTNLNPFIEEEYWYVQVDEEGIIGQERKSVNYELPAVNEEGEQKDIEFTALSELREGAYIQLTVENEFVTTYEEVDEDDLP